jgi:hypothetical protein
LFGSVFDFFVQAICKTAENIAKPIIAEQIPKYKIDAVEFETLTLGTLPPTFHGEQGGSYLFGLLREILKMHPCVFALYIIIKVTL